MGCVGIDILIFNFIFSSVPLPVEMTLMFAQGHAQPFRSDTDQSLSPQAIVPGALSGLSAPHIHPDTSVSIWLPTDIPALCTLV